MWRNRYRTWGSVVFIGAASALLICRAPTWAWQPAAAPVADVEQETRSKIDHLIRQLGDSQYTNREKAQEDLLGFGTAAFDALLVAQDDPDIEIAQRARYLVRSISIAWTSDTDTPEVKGLLANFGTLARQERKTRAQHLATLDGISGLGPLCRIVRFDPDRVLSKQAALLVMSREVPDNPVERKRIAEVIRGAVVQSTRPAIEWLLTYCRELDHPQSTLTDWERITRAELTTLAKTPHQSDREVARDLLRWQTMLLLRRNGVPGALANFRRTYDLIQDNAQEIYEAIDWSLENNLLSAPEEIAARFESRVRGEPRLLYRLAEAQLKRGHQAAADKTAAEASQLNPMNHMDHLAIAALLHQRGLVDWSANEYRHVIANVKVESEHSLDARNELSKMLFDAGQEFEAAETLKPLVEFAGQEGKNNELAQVINTFFRGNMHYWYGLHFAKLGDRGKQIDHFNQAIEASPTNIDILIAMYRVPDPEPKWKQDVQQKIDAHLGKCRALIAKYEDLLRRQPNLAGAAGEDLATAYNELAWLISNTSGDFQEAVRASQRSLELSPNNEAYLDTLGRCYFSAGDLENAVKSQRRAVAATPHVQVMQRQLKQFEAAWAESKAKAAKDGPTKKS